jgi:hypothetical protein
MISDRTYQRARTPEEVMKELVNGAGSQWDPNIIDSFIQWWTEDNFLSPIRWNLKFTRNVYKDILASATATDSNGSIILVNYGAPTILKYLKCA